MKTIIKGVLLIFVSTFISCQSLPNKERIKVASFKKKRFNIILNDKLLEKIKTNSGSLLNKTIKDISQVKVHDPNPYDSLITPYLIIDFKINLDTISCVGIKLNKICEVKKSETIYNLQTNYPVWVCWYTNCSGFDFQWDKKNGILEINDIYCVHWVNDSLSCNGNFKYLSEDLNVRFWDHVR